MKIQTSKCNFSVSHDGYRGEFYFQLRWFPYFFWTNFLSFNFKGGFSNRHHIHTGHRNVMDSASQPWREFNSYGIFFDFTLFGLSLGIYCHPFVWERLGYDKFVFCSLFKNPLYLPNQKPE